MILTRQNGRLDDRPGGRPREKLYLSQHDGSIFINDNQLGTGAFYEFARFEGVY